MAEKIVLEVEGMTCNSCAQGITRHLAKKGVRDVFVNYEEGRVEMEPDPVLSVESVIDEINSLGYTAYQKSDQPEKRDPADRLKKRFLISLLLTLPLLLHMFTDLPLLHNGYFQLLLAIPVVLIGLSWFGKSAWGSLRALQPNMDVLILSGALSAFVYSTWGLLLHGVHGAHNYLFFETAAAIITFVLLGNLIEHKSLKKTKDAVSTLLLLQPAKARRITNALTDDERVEEISADAVRANDLLMVNTGDRIPADGMIYWGSASIDESAMTGEFMPAEKNVNDSVLAGTMVLSGSIKMIVHAAGSATVLNNVITLVREATAHKPSIQRLGDRVSAWFVPAVLLIAAGTFLVTYFALDKGMTESIMRSIAVLVISCPCAMGLATPTAVSVAIGRATREGILIKGGHLLEIFSKVKSVFIDKTGTLTGRMPFIREIIFTKEKDEVLYIIHALEKHSSHPIAKALLQLPLPSEKHSLHFSSIEEEKGFGIHATDTMGNVYFIGSGRKKSMSSDHQVYVLKNGETLATIDLGEEIREDAAELIRYFRDEGIKTVLVSGDTAAACRPVAEALGIDEVHAGCLPGDKSALIKKAAEKGRVAMIGDGINDGPSLAVADVGISFGSATQVAMQTAGIIIMDENHLSPVIRAHQLSKAALVTIKQNLFWALIYNIVAIPVAAAGYLSPILSSFSMAFSDVIVIGNSMRLRIRNIFGKKTTA